MALFEQLQSCEVKPGDILISLVGTTGKVLILPDDCAPGIIKTRNHGLQDVREQAFNYVENLKLDCCGKVLLTDGGRFYLYERELGNKAWSDQAVGYLNVEKIRTNHIAPPSTSAIDTIVALTPAGAGRPVA